MPDWVAREAYSHEVSSAGFWPGQRVVPGGRLLLLRLPRAGGFPRRRRCSRAAARFDQTLGEFVLPYDAVRTSARPGRRRCSPSCRAPTRRRRTVRHWDRAALETQSRTSLDPSFRPGLYECAQSNAGRRTMVRGAVLYNFHEALKVESLELKPPRADEVVVKVAASGVCHSDLSVQQMKLPVPPPVRARPRGRRHRRGGRQGRHARSSPAITSCSPGSRTAAAVTTASPARCTSARRASRG